MTTTYTPPDRPRTTTEKGHGSPTTDAPPAVSTERRSQTPMPAAIAAPAHARTPTPFPGRSPSVEMPAVPSFQSTRTADTLLAAAPSASRKAIDDYLELMSDRGASDFHLSVGNPPLLRLHGHVEPIRYRRLTGRDFVALIEPITPPELWKSFLRTGDVDFSYEISGLARFRVNLFMQERGCAAVFRLIPSQVVTLEQLGMPEAVGKFCELESGLVLVTGPTGSGKSTTLAAIINEINQTRPRHIITIEDPIEFVHPLRRSLVTQREVGMSTRSFADALRSAVREDPNIIMVGEMRDLETTSLALHAAATGVLVFGTLHTNSATKTVDRIINVFPENETTSVRNVLGESLKAVLAQQLVRRKAGGRVAALEIMFSTPGMGTMIRDARTHQLTSLIQLGRKMGMISMDESLARLVHRGEVDVQVAQEKCIDRASFRALVGLPPEEDGEPKK